MQHKNDISRLKHLPKTGKVSIGCKSFSGTPDQLFQPLNVFGTAFVVKGASAWGLAAPTFARGTTTIETLGFWEGAGRFSF